MTPEQIKATDDYIRGQMDAYHASRISKLAELKPAMVLARKNPYMFLCKNMRTANEFAELILQAHSSSSEETAFGILLEGIAVFVSNLRDGGQKSSTAGIDLDFTRDHIRYLVAIKSGHNWGNSDQINKLKLNFTTAKRVIGQDKNARSVQSVLGVCYGKRPVQDNGDYRIIGGQAFWDFISGVPTFYTDIIEPISSEADQHSDAYAAERDKALNRFDKYILTVFCDESGVIDWERFVKFNSGNLT
jgi:hypothetical protein